MLFDRLKYQCSVCFNIRVNKVLHLYLPKVPLIKLFNNDQLSRKAVCKPCFDRFYLLGAVLEESFKKKEYKAKDRMKMQTSSSGELGTQVETDKAVENEEKSKEHGYRCACNKCQQEYGNLPLLVRVIDESGGIGDPSTSSSPLASTSATGSVKKSKKEILCPKCSKVFHHKGDMNKHLRSHTKEKPFSCEDCGKKFQNSSNLCRHKRLHSGNKPFACSTCNKRFYRKDKLDAHRKSKLCQRASSQNDSFE